VIKIAAIVLLLAFVLPGIILGLFVSPWFLLFCLALIFVPLLFIRPAGGR
jgi:hypothetical protein